MIANRSYDCVVIGSGPAGGSVACLVAEQGWSTLLIEREKLPRYHVGESLIPETWWVLERLGLVQELQRIGFTRKNGVQVITADDCETPPFVFSDFDDRDCATSWHVQRAEFDKLLFDAAYNRGATVVDGTQVLEIDIRKQSPHKITIRGADGKDQELSARVVVDASGLQSLIANQLELKEYPDKLKKAAIWGYFEGAARSGGSNPELKSIFWTASQDAWFWYIPLSDGTVGVGLVGDSEFVLRRGSSPEKTFQEEVRNCPAVARKLAGSASRGKYHVAKDFSYTTRRQAGDGWVLVGDAGGSLDPVCDAGVFLACTSAALAADAIGEGLQKNDLSARILGRWTSKYEAGVDLIRRLVRAIYAKPFALDEFIQQYPQHRENLVKLLAGRVFEGNAGAIFEDLEPWIAELKGGKPRASSLSR